jgi:hypothetical protein
VRPCLSVEHQSLGLPILWVVIITSEGTGHVATCIRSKHGTIIFFYYYWWGGTKSLGTTATSGLLYKPQMIDEDDCRAVGGMKIGRGNRSTRRKPAPAPLCPPQIKHATNWTTADNLSVPPFLNLMETVMNKKKKNIMYYKLTVMSIPNILTRKSVENSIPYCKSEAESEGLTQWVLLIGTQEA